jgi:hypothetical protein
MKNVEGFFFWKIFADFLRKVKKVVFFGGRILAKSRKRKYARNSAKFYPTQTFYPTLELYLLEEFMGKDIF